MKSGICGTKPWHPFDLLIWWIIWLFWEPFSVKRSHWWHWRHYAGKRKIYLAVGDHNAKPRDTAWANFWQVNFGWKTVIVFQPEGLSFYGKYRLGYVDDNGQMKICSLILCGPCGALLGPKPTKFFAIGLDGSPLTLKSLCITTKDDLDDDIPLI